MIRIRILRCQRLLLLFIIFLIDRTLWIFCSHSSIDGVGVRYLCNLWWNLSLGLHQVVLIIERGVKQRTLPHVGCIMDIPWWSLVSLDPLYSLIISGRNPSDSSVLVSTLLDSLDLWHTSLLHVWLCHDLGLEISTPLVQTLSLYLLCSTCLTSVYIAYTILRSLCALCFPWMFVRSKSLSLSERLLKPLPICIWICYLRVDVVRKCLFKTIMSLYACCLCLPFSLDWWIFTNLPSTIVCLVLFLCERENAIVFLWLWRALHESRETYVLLSPTYCSSISISLVEIVSGWYIIL